MQFFFPPCCTNIANFQTYEFKDKDPIGRDLWLIPAWNKDDQPDCFRTAAVSSLSMQRTTHKNRTKWCIFLESMTSAISNYFILYTFFWSCISRAMHKGSIESFFDDWTEKILKNHTGCVVYSPCVQTIDIWWFLSYFSFSSIHSSLAPFFFENFLPWPMMAWPVRPTFPCISKGGMVISSDLWLVKWNDHRIL